MGCQHGFHRFNLHRSTVGVHGSVLRVEGDVVDVVDADLGGGLIGRGDLEGERVGGEVGAAVPVVEQRVAKQESDHAVAVQVEFESKV